MNCKIKRLIGIICAVCIAACMCGCGTKGNTASDGKVTISLGDFFEDEAANPDGYARNLELVKKFEELHPNVKIENAKWNFSVDTYMAKAEGGTLPTVYYIPLTEGSKVIELGYAADITDEFKERGMYDNLNEFMLNNISRDGNIYLVPEGNYDVGIMVNIDLYKKAGFIDDEGNLYQPETWEDLAQTAKTIKEKTGVDGFVLPTIGNCGGWRFMPIAWSYGTVFEKKVDGKWQSAFNSPECIEAMQYISDLKWKYDVLPDNNLVELSKVSELFAANNVAMCMAEKNTVDSLINNYKFDKNKIGMLKLPAGPKKHVTLMGGGYRVIDKNASPEQIKAAMDWLEYLGVSVKLTDDKKESLKKDTESSVERGHIVGLNSVSPWKDSCEVMEYRNQLGKEYMNVDPKHIEKYNDKGKIEYRAEEEIDAQALYALLDSVIQEVLVNKNADIPALIEKASKDFQKNNLDYAN